IGIAAAYGVALAARAGEDVARAAAELASVRPTAANLRWAVGRARAAADTEAEAVRIHQEQRAADAQMATLGAALLEPGSLVLTHCNTGALATGGSGTALGVIIEAWRRGRVAGVMVCETRPLLQGARLTSWELAQHGVSHSIIVDSAAAGIISRGIVHAVLVGADRIAANGDTANKVGTYGLALAAHAHNVPFYVVAPISTIDPQTPTGQDVPIEERPPSEVLSFAGTNVAPARVGAANPAFDRTPGDLITAIVTERGVLRPPYGAAITAIQRTAVAP
ncbi:MAG TPA: S-methyl-5-thioribose-1-phosphate isomerase, partial [Dehalococcoidia bacterium]|nr:S-methyl-5-thioribose-1-phosphate isomerase [Dehalococcoidia bacterium]